MHLAKTAVLVGEEQHAEDRRCNVERAVRDFEVLPIHHFGVNAVAEPSLLRCRTKQIDHSRRKVCRENGRAPLSGGKTEVARSRRHVDDARTRGDRNEARRVFGEWECDLSRKGVVVRCRSAPGFRNLVGRTIHWR